MIRPLILAKRERGTPDHELILRDIEIVAKQLLEFQREETGNF